MVNSETSPKYFVELAMPDVSRLAGRIAEVDLEDAVQVKEVITQITSALIRIDTNTLRHHGHTQAFKVIEALIVGCLNDGWQAYYRPGEDNRRSLIIHPQCLPNGGDGVNALHVHIDTAGGRNGEGLIPMLGDDGDLLLGVGSCDMKGQVAVAILLLESMRKAKCKNIALVVTSDEELGGLFGGRKAWGEFNADWWGEMEPTGQHFGRLVSQIVPSYNVAFEISPDLASTNGSKLMLLKALMRSRGGSLRQSQCELAVSFVARNFGSEARFEELLNMVEKRWGIKAKEVDIDPGWNLELPADELERVLQIIKSRGLPTPPRQNLANLRRQFLTTSELAPGGLQVILSERFGTLSTLMGMKNVVNIGPAEAGKGRHSGAGGEGVRLSHLYEVFVIMNQLLQKNRA